MASVGGAARVYRCEGRLKRKAFNGKMERKDIASEVTRVSVNRSTKLIVERVRSVSKAASKCNKFSSQWRG